MLHIPRLVKPAAIHRIQTAFPTTRVLQSENRDQMLAFIESKPAKFQVQKRMLGDWITQVFDNSGITDKNMAFHPREIFNNRGRSETVVNNACWEQARELVRDASRRSLQAAEIEARDITAVFLESEVVNGLSLESAFIEPGCNPHLEPYPMYGQGCAGGAKVMAMAFHYLQTYPEAAVQVVALDMYSRLWAYSYGNVIDELLPRIADDKTAFDLLRSSLMMAVLIGDGVASTVLVGKRHPLFRKWTREQDCYYICGAAEAVDPAAADSLAVMAQEYGLVAVLRPTIAENGARVVGMALDRLRERYGVTSSPDFHCAHPGGPRVLDAFENRLGIPHDDLEMARRTLDMHGNMAAPTVLIELEKMQATARKCTGVTETGVMVAVGPGMKACSLLLKRGAPPLQ
jgi:alkylresorcinol/alkylpyrone synthase